MTHMAFKTSLVTYLFGLMDHLALHKMVEGVMVAAAPVAAGATAAAGESWVYPAALLAAPLIRMAEEYFEKKKKPEDLADLYRESLLHAIEACVKDNHHLTSADHGIVQLWEEGLEVGVKGDALWKAILEDNLPARMLSADLRDASKCWPLLRSQLERWTNWFEYRRTAGSAPPGFDIPRQPLVLSSEFERSLAANLPRELLQRFQPELVDGHHRDAFKQSMLRILGEISQELRPLDPVRHIREFPKPQEANTALKLLDAEYRVVPYLGRRRDLDALWNWLESPVPVACQVVVGRGGSGKTRLAYQFLEEIESRQPFLWHAGILHHERFEDELRNQAFRKWRGRRPTLIVIDYADAAAPLLEKYIIPELARTGLGPEDAPIRFLLLARTADATQGWYQTLRRAAGNREDDLFPNKPLDLSPLDSGQRRELVAAMLAAAPRAKDEPKARLSLPPEGSDLTLDARLAESEFADPLVLSMAAIVAHGQQSLGALHLHRTDLARGMAKHERRRLERLAINGDRDFLLHMAAYVTLAGRMTFDQLEQAAKAEKSDLETSWRTAEVAAILAPNPIAEPVAPDIVGEAFVHDVLRESAQHGSATLKRTADFRPGSVTRMLVRTVQDYAPDPAHLSAEDEQCQSWALTGLTALLRRHAETITDDVFWEISAALPEHTVAMILPVRDFYLSVCRVRDLATSGVGLAALVSYSIYESMAGNRTQALDAIQEAVENYRELAGKNREAFLPNLAMSLNNQANLQSAMGQRGEALQSIREAVMIRRELAGKNREAFLPNLATALNNQANRQSDMGQRTDALQSIQEAVMIRRELVGKNREAFLPNLAMSLNNQANRQSAMGQPAEALQSIQEAVMIRRESVGQNREAFLPDLATSLNNQARFQSEMGQRGEALQSIQEAVENYRELAGKNRQAFLPDLAMSLNNLACFQSEMGQRGEALQSVQEAVEIRRELVGKNREAFLPNLATALNNQAKFQSEMGQRGEALQSIQEAVENYRELTGKNPQAFLPDLAMSLNNQASFQSEMGQRAEALQSIQEAVKIRRELVGKNREAFLPNLAVSLGAYGQVLLALEKPTEAAGIFAEGVRLISPLARKLPQAHFRLATALAKAYLGATSAAGMEPDPECTWPLDLTDTQ